MTLVLKGNMAKKLKKKSAIGLLLKVFTRGAILFFGPLLGVFITGTILSFGFFGMDLVVYNCMECAHIVIKPDGSDSVLWNDDLRLRFLGYEIAAVLVLAVLAVLAIRVIWLPRHHPTAGKSGAAPFERPREVKP